MSLSPVLAVTEAPASRRERDYAELVTRVRELVQAEVPEGAAVAVVSRGDSSLLQFAGRHGWHFPRTASGAYAGHHPAGDDDAIARLEAIRAEGASFLVFPATTYWWLDFYGGFKNHLESRYRRIADRQDTAIVYSLSGADVDPRGGPSQDPVITQLRSIAGGLLPAGAKVLVVSRGDELLLELGGPVGWHFPQRPGGRHSSDDPPDSDAAIAHLAALRDAGAEYLIVPRGAVPWVESYAEFRAFLQRRFAIVTRQEHVCTIYDLGSSEKGLTVDV